MASVTCMFQRHVCIYANLKEHVQNIRPAKDRRDSIKKKVALLEAEMERSPPATSIPESTQCQSYQVASL